MSTNELIPLFPSATHPALPIAAQILATLRSLTAAGRGNDLRPEERAALVGVSALLGCEKIQSKDLPESSAQKASSVSPAHFRSALQHARRILKNVSIDAPKKSPRASSSKSKTTITASSTASTASILANALASTSGLAAGDPSDRTLNTDADPLSPFSTPKKRFKYSSGVDISTLVRSGGKRLHYEPGTSSPLRHSVTPSGSKRRAAMELDIDVDKIEEADGETEGTPTKRIKYALNNGVDLEKQVAVLNGPSQTTGRRECGTDTSAFFAMRPGSGTDAGEADGNLKGKGKAVDDGLDWGKRRSRRSEQEKVGQVAKKRERSRRDWTYTETRWDGERLREQGRTALDKLFQEAPAWIASRGIPSSREEVTAQNVVALLLSHLEPEDQRLADIIATD